MDTTVFASASASTSASASASASAFTSASTSSESSPFFRPTRTTSINRSSSRNNNSCDGRETEDSEDANSVKCIDEAHTATLMGCSSNLMNAIIGAGIVGIPYAIQQCGGLFVGVLMIVVVSVGTEKSLRLLIHTAASCNTAASHVPQCGGVLPAVQSYETLAERAYGKLGFYFVTLSMLVLSCGGMISYLIIIEETFTTLLFSGGYDSASPILMMIGISVFIVIPLSCQRDIADLAKTSQLNVVFDTIMVLLVVYLSFTATGEQQQQQVGEYDDGISSIATATAMNSTISSPSTFYFHTNNDDGDTDDDNTNTSDYDANSNSSTPISLLNIQYKTIFVGLGVLSFAFVCQHSAFIIAGSLQNPTKSRWAIVSKYGVYSATLLALIMGIFGYRGFSSSSSGTTMLIDGNILNNVPIDSCVANLARLLLGMTMILVYPMELFVARHACVVLFFYGHDAHHGNDSAVLARTDRRIVLTTIIYCITLLPALFLCSARNNTSTNDNNSSSNHNNNNALGTVLAITG